MDWFRNVTDDELTISNIGETLILTHLYDDNGENRLEYNGTSYAEIWIDGDCVYEVLVRRPGGHEPGSPEICEAVRAFAALDEHGRELYQLATESHRRRLAAGMVGEPTPHRAHPRPRPRVEPASVTGGG